MPTAVVGKSLIAFGTAVLLSSFVCAFILGAFTVDIGAIVVIMLGMSVAGGSQRAIRWSIAAMVCYLLIAVLVLLGGYLRAESLKIAGYAASPAVLRWLLPMVGIFAVWSLANIVLLKRALPTAT